MLILQNVIFTKQVQQISELKHDDLNLQRIKYITDEYVQDLLKLYNYLYVDIYFRITLLNLLMTIFMITLILKIKLSFLQCTCQ